eukprot:GGOE01003126.1.p1 GENE.GGOE01003126.1~~GGOE01003126.1.p1  ORF type:complete len:534 (+),score=97.68 GGOE01003126.1:168-1604(+)
MEEMDDFFSTSPIIDPWQPSVASQWSHGPANHGPGWWRDPDGEQSQPTWWRSPAPERHVPAPKPTPNPWGARTPRHQHSRIPTMAASIHSMTPASVSQASSVRGGQRTVEQQQSTSSGGLQPTTPTTTSNTTTIPSTAIERRGFQNIGNTCYINAMLSAITNLTCFVNDLLDPDLWQHLVGCSAPTLQALARISQQSVAQDRGSINPLVLKEAVAMCKEEFSSFQQQDAHEFLLAMLDQVHEEVRAAWGASGGETPSPVQRNFEGAITHERMCIRCRHVTTSVERFYVLSLPLPENSEGGMLTIEDLLGRFLQPAIQEFTCARCRHRQARVQHRFSALPRVLVLHVQRSSPLFAADGRFLGHAKRTDACPPIQCLDVEQHCQQDVLFPPALAHRPSDLPSGVAPREDVLYGYALRACTLHLGEEANGGHYKSLVAQPAGLWLEYDDEHVTPISETAAVEGGKHNSYLLFYQFCNMLLE